MSWSAYAQPGVRVRPSDAESARFGRSVVRVDVGRSEASDVARALAEAQADVLIVRFDARRRDIARIVAATDRVVLPAGTLTYWEREAGPLKSFQRDPSLQVLSIDVLGEESRSVVESIIRDSFAAYPNHYAVNPFFAPELAEAGYVEWALSRIGDETGHVLVLTDSDEPIGVATLTDLGDEVEIELAGLVARAQGRGAYGALLEACAELAWDLGRSRLVISTQVDNVRVQRAWVRCGFKPFTAVETVHLVARSG